MMIGQKPGRGKVCTYACQDGCFDGGNGETFKGVE